jgi:flagellar hook-length control protein FliK
MNLISLDAPSTPTSLGGFGEGAVRPAEEATESLPFGQMLAEALRHLPGQELAVGALKPDPTAETDALQGLAALDEAALALAPGSDLGAAAVAGQASVGLLAAPPGAGGLPWGEDLQSLNLGPTVRLITTADAPPDDLSLADFARAQGFDETATRWLLGLAPAAPPTSAQPGAQAGVAAPAADLLTPVVQVPQGGVVDAKPLELLTGALQLAGLVGGRERSPSVAPPTDADPSAALINLARKVPLLAGVQGLLRQAAVRGASDNPAPAFVNVVLDLELDVPDGLQGPQALKALQDWLEQGPPQVGGKGEAPVPGLAAADTAAARLGVSTPGVLADRSAAAASEATQQRTEQYQALTQRIGEALAQRLVAQVERGNWHVRLMLRPQSLGQVEVELRMRSGELEASFRAPQALTRELINDSLPRLREVLSQMGMDVASFDVAGRQGEPSGGNPTPREQAHGAAAQSAEQATPAESLAVSRPARVGLDGWDVLV